MSNVYGPVPSWRLGRSLGIDLISAQGKTCTFDALPRAIQKPWGRGELIFDNHQAGALHRLRRVLGGLS